MARLGKAGDAVEKMIEECAHKIIVILEKMGEANILRLSEHLAERSVITYQALGWLAREGRVRYERRGNQVYVALQSGEPPASIDSTQGG
jgi:hypothetical protein